jgi:hypothetical protein
LAFIGLALASAMPAGFANEFAVLLLAMRGCHAFLREIFMWETSHLKLPASSELQPKPQIMLGLMSHCFFQRTVLIFGLVQNCSQISILRIPSIGKGYFYLSNFWPGVGQVVLDLNFSVAGKVWQRQIKLHPPLMEQQKCQINFHLSLMRLEKP